MDTIASHVAKNRDTKRTAVMQIDADGAEWDALWAVPGESLDRITQMAIELHGTDERRFVQVMLLVNQKIGVLDPNGPSPAPVSSLNAPDAPDLLDCQLATRVR